MRSLDELQSAVRDWHDRLLRVVLPPALPHPVTSAQALEALINLFRRANEGSRAPVRIALFGPTGAGKSKLFNSLIREPLSPSSFRRPCTRRPFYCIHERHGEIARGLRGEVHLHRRESWADMILIDAPDFDSVEAENRAMAAQIYLEADAFIFVADVHKYADSATWIYLQRIRKEGKACIHVLNKIQGEAKEAAASTWSGGPATPASGGPVNWGPLEDFRERLERLYRPGGLPGPVVGIFDLAIGDEDLLGDDEPGFRALRDALVQFLTEGPKGERQLLAESFRIDLARFISEWDRFAAPLRKYRSGLERLERETGETFGRAAAGLRRDLQAEVDPALKGEVYREVLRRIERIDILRYPRRLIALPARGLKALFDRFWTGKQAEGGSRRTVGTAGAAMNLAALEGRLRMFWEELRGSVRAEEACPGLLDEESWRSLRMDHSALRERFRRSQEEFRIWAEEEARSTASVLTAEHKVKFILSQIIYNTVVIGVQLKTAGTLTLTEIFADGVLSPLVAKAVGMAVSSERVMEFESRAQAEFARRLQGILEEARDRLQEHFASIGRGMGEVEAIHLKVEELRSVQDRLVDAFREARP